MALDYERTKLLLDQLLLYKNYIKNIQSNISDFVSVGQQIATNPDFLEQFPETGPEYITYITGVVTAIGSSVSQFPTEPPL